MTRPELKQFGDLVEDDFHRHPVWVSCHGEDAGQPWFDETDEETFRPWTGALPVHPSDGMFLARAFFELANGAFRKGFVTPAFQPDAIGQMQPHLFAGGQFGFWGGLRGVPYEDRQSFYAALDECAPRIFPIHFAAEGGLVDGVAEGVINGFYRRVGDDVVVDV